MLTHAYEPPGLISSTEELEVVRSEINPQLPKVQTLVLSFTTAEPRFALSHRLQLPVPELDLAEVESQLSFGSAVLPMHEPG